MRILTLLTCLLFLACAHGANPVPHPTPGGDDTTVCIDNQRPIYVRAEVRDSYSGAEYGEIAVGGLGRRCERVPLATAGETVTVHLQVVGGPDATPPGFRDLMVTRRAMHLTVGMDGVTPYSHSYRSQR